MNTSSFRCTLHILSAIAALGLIGNHSAHAAARTWIGNTNANFGTPANWNTLPVADDSWTFGLAGSSGTSLNNDLTLNLSVGGMTFNANAAAYTISGTAVTLAGNIANNNTATQTINLQMILSGERTITTYAGSEIILGGRLMDPSGDTKGSLIKAGTGILTLNASNTYDGDTTVNAGTLRLGPSGGIANGAGNGNVIVNASGTFDLYGNTEQINGLSGAGTVTNSAATAVTIAVGDADQTTTFSGIIEGNLALEKIGDGILTLDGDNTYSGNTTVTAGTLKLGPNDALPNGVGKGNVIVNGTLDLNGHGESINGLSGTGTVDSKAAGTVALTVGGNDASGTFSGVIQNTAGTVSITKNGTGELVLSGANTFSGGVTLNAGTLTTGGLWNQALGAGTLTLNGGELHMNTSANGGQNYASNTTVGGDVTITVDRGDGLQGTGYAYQLGTLGMGAQTLTVQSGPNSTTSSSTLTFGATTLTGASTFATVKAGQGVGLTLASLSNGGYTPTFKTGTDLSTEITISGVVSGAGGLKKQGGTYVAGALRLTGNNTYTGATSIEAGIIYVTSLNSVNGGAPLLASSSLGAPTTVANGTISLGSGGTGAALNYAGTGETTDRVINLAGTIDPGVTAVDRIAFGGSGTLKFTSDLTVSGSGNKLFYLTSYGSGTLEFSGQIADGAAVVSVTTSSGKVTLSGANTYSGDTALNGGTLTLGNANALAGSTLSTNTTWFTTVNFFAGTNNIGGLKGDGNLANGGNLLSVGANNQSTSYSGVMSGTGGLTKVGSGALTLSGSNAFSGGFALNQGTVLVGNDNALGADTNTATINGGTLASSDSTTHSLAQATTVKGDFALGQASGGTGALTLSGAMDLGDSTRQITVANSADTISGNITGTGGLTKAGSGILTLDGDSTYNGDTTVSAGTLKLGPNNALPNGAGKGNVIVSGTLDINGYGEKINGLAGSGTVDNSSATAAELAVGDNNQTTAFNGTIRNTGGALSLEKLGTGTLTLGGANTYSGDTTISAGALKLGASNTLPYGVGKGNVVLNGAMDLDTFNQTLNGLSGNGIVDKSGAGMSTLTVGNNDQTSTFSGVIQNTVGTVALTKMGSGILTLTGANTYAGATRVSAGTLVINGSTATDSTVTVEYGATLGGGGTVGGNTTISGTHTPGNSPGLQTFESNLTYENGSTVIWELNSNTINGRGTSFDGITVNGDLTINATSALNLVFNGTGSTVDWTNDLWATDQEWLFFSVGGTTLGTLTMGVVSADMNGIFLVAVRPNASFSTTTSGGNILVTYTVVPEPSTLLLVALAGIAGLLARRRKAAL